MAGSQVGELVIGLKFDGKNLTASLNGIEKQVEKTGTTSGSKLGQALVFAAGNLIAKGVSKIAGLITENFDSAIRRLDTLNNFPRVMENMGISAQKSQKAINKISDGLKGLPTSLDAGARAVQRLTSVNGDINKSTKYFLAMNNAIIAGSASAELQSSAIEQLAQAYSKGRMDMMEWRTLQMAMPAQLNQVAKAMGITTDALGEGLRKGDISMEQFMQTVSRLNKEGVSGFASFEQQAKGATSGVQTAIANMNTAVARGITNILEAIGSENIANYFAQTGEKIEAMANAMASAIKWIQANSEELKIFGSVVAGVGSALVTANIAGEVNTIWQVMKLGGGISGFTSNLAQLPGTLGKVGMALSNTGKGFGSLFSVLKAHPTLAIVSAIVGALAVFFTQTETGRKILENIMGVVSKVFATISQAVGPVLDTIGQALSDAFSKIGDVLGNIFEKIGPSLMMFLNSIGQTLGGALSKIGPMLTKVLGKLGEVFAQIVEYMAPVINDLFPALEPMLQSFQELFQTLVESAQEIGQALIPLGEAMMDLFKSLIPPFAELAKTLIPIVIDAAKALIPVIGTIGQTLASILPPVLEVIKALLPPLLELIQAILPAITQFIQAILPVVVQVLQLIIPPLVAILSVIANILAVILTVVAKIISFVLPIIVNVITTIIKIVIGVINVVMSVITAIITGVTKVIQFVTSVITGIISFISGAINKIAGFFQGLWTKIKSIFSGIGNFFRGVFNTIKSIFQNIAQKIGNTVGGIIKGAINGVLTIAENIINGPIRALNGMIDIINNIPGVSIGKIKEWKLPRMATGGVVNSATTAIIGEAGREAVLPLDRNTQWAGILADKLVDELESDEVGFGRPIQVTINNNIDNRLDAQEIGNLMMTSIRRAA